jgi:hypothetical protein
VDEKAFHQRRASRLLKFAISELRFPIETPKPLEKSGGFFNFQKTLATDETRMKINCCGFAIAARLIVLRVFGKR